MKVNLLAVFLILITSASMAAAAPFPSYYQGAHKGIAPAQQAAEPAQLLKAGINKLTAFIRSGGANDKARATAFLQQEIAPYFDFAYMTRWAAGPAWRRMNPEQRASMQGQLAESFMTILAQQLTTYSNQSIRYFTPRGQSREDVTVSAWIMQPDGYPTKLEFRFYQSKAGWKIFDVKAAGNSAVVYYRNLFKNMYSHGSQPRHYN
ncbi:MAG: ABC transporter substrate-binding protein [Gammaproteobacteria bacterium]|nr:ABC transporter substrate-binding protein [Gammaproteobacteria bacterium]MDH3560620.1 ABC transporter substrate-binding protein [Gammaproteobacteria bacterium]